jgi:tetratricopeptide (TPR) repeat protein
LSAVARRYFLRGRELQREGDAEGAGQAFGAALELCPNFVEARIASALTLLCWDPPRAAQLLRSGLRRTTRAHPRAQLLCALGDVLVASGDFPGAATAYAEAARLPGATPSLHGRVARLSAKTGQYPEAFSAMLEAARVSGR